METKMEEILNNNKFKHLEIQTKVIIVERVIMDGTILTSIDLILIDNFRQWAITINNHITHPAIKLVIVLFN